MLPKSSQFRSFLTVVQGVRFGSLDLASRGHLHTLLSPLRMTCPIVGQRAKAVLRVELCRI